MSSCYHGAKGRCVLCFAGVGVDEHRHNSKGTYRLTGPGRLIYLLLSYHAKLPAASQYMLDMVKDYIPAPALRLKARSRRRVTPLDGAWSFNIPITPMPCCVLHASRMPKFPVPEFLSVRAANPGAVPFGGSWLAEAVLRLVKKSPPLDAPRPVGRCFCTSVQFFSRAGCSPPGRARRGRLL